MLLSQSTSETPSSLDACSTLADALLNSLKALLNSDSDARSASESPTRKTAQFATAQKQMRL